MEEQACWVRGLLVPRRLGAIKHWRDIMQILGSRLVDAQVSLTLGSDVEDGAVKESVQTLTDLETMLTQLTEAQG